MMPTPFVLNDAVVIRQKISKSCCHSSSRKMDPKPSSKIQKTTIADSLKPNNKHIMTKLAF
jgi:hypothetical protein